MLCEALSQTKYCRSPEVKIFGPPKISGWLRYRPRACSKKNISVISVLTLRNILIVNTKIIKYKLSSIFVAEVFIKLVSLCINRHTRNSPQLQKGWWFLLWAFKMLHVRQLNVLGSSFDCSSNHSNLCGFQRRTSATQPCFDISVKYVLIRDAVPVYYKRIFIRSTKRTECVKQLRTILS